MVENDLPDFPKTFNPLLRTKFLLSILLGCWSLSGLAQLRYTSSEAKDFLQIHRPEFKIETRKFGALLGVQRGKYTFFELGAEKQWKTVRLTRPPTLAVNGTMQYNIANNILGYKVSVWAKQGRIALTYGLHFAHVTDFDHHRVGGGPQIGFKLLGFHLVNGYNFYTRSTDFQTHNTFFISLRYFFINKRKFDIEKSKKGDGKKKKKDKKDKESIFDKLKNDN